MVKKIGDFDMNVYYLTNAPTPYKVAFWEELGKLCNLTVLLEVDNSKERNSSWRTGKRNNYTEIVMPNLYRNDSGAFCPVVSKYLKKKNGIVIINGYNTLTGIFSIIFLKIHRLPYIISADGGLLKQEKKYTYLIKKMLIQGAEGYLSSGSITDKYLIHYGVNKHRIGHYPFTSVSEQQVLKCIIDNQKKRMIRENLGIDCENMILFVGQIIPRKGIDVLLNACCGLSNDTKVYLIGGKPTEEYKKIIDDNKLDNVEFLDFIQHDQLKEYYMAADIFVIPTREDIWGLVVNEAMAYGLPVITTNRCVSGMEMIRNKDTGIIVKVNDVKGLHNAILKLLNDKDDLQKKSRCALERAHEYTIEKMAMNTYNYLNKIKNYLGKEFL